MIGISTRSRLLGSAVLGAGFLALVPSAASAACVVTPAASPVTGTVVCGTTTTADTTYPVNAATGTDRNYLVDTSAGDVTGTVSTGATVDGYGLAFTNTVGGANTLNVVNNGTVQVNAGNTATAGGTAALNATAIGATNLVYTGTGSVANLGTAGDGLNLSTSGTGNITATVGGNVTAATGGSGVNLQNTGTAGNLSVTTATGTTIRAGGPLTGGVLAQIQNAANPGNVTVVNNATVASLTGTPNTLFVGVGGTSNGTGIISVTNNGAVGSATDRAQFFAVYAAHGGTAGNVAVVNGAGSIFGVNGILGQSISSGSIAVTTGTGAVNAVDTGILVNAGGTSNVTTVTTGTGAVTASAATGIGIDVLGVTNTAATTVTTGGTVTGGATGIRVNTVGTQAITANGVTTGTTDSGIHSNTTAARTITVGTNGNVTGGTQAILLTGTGGGSITNSGVIGALTGTPPVASGLAINAATATGALAVTNNAGGTINGRMTLGAGTDTFANSGTFNTQGVTDFGAGADTLTNNASGVINLTGNTTLANLETLTQNGRINLNTFVLTGPAAVFTNGTTGIVDTSGNAGLAGFTAIANNGTFDLAAGTFTAPAGAFTNNASGIVIADEGLTTITGQTTFANAGTIDLADGVTNDVLTLNSSYSGSGAAQLQIDTDGVTADRLVINGAASGSTAVDVNVLSVNLAAADILVVDTTSTTANAFVIGDITGAATPLADYTIVQNGQDFFLAVAPSAAAFDPLQVIGAAGDFWYQSADEVLARTRMPNDISGVSVWAQGYISQDKYGDEDSVVVGGVTYDIDNELKTKRYGVQAGLDLGNAGGFRGGLTGGYAKAEGKGRTDVDIDGWNVGLYGQFGGTLGFHGEVLAKQDTFKIEFADGVFDGVRTDGRSTGFDGGLGYRFAIGGDSALDVNAGISHVRTKIDDLEEFGFGYDYDRLTSTRGRAGVRANLGGSLKPYADATVYHEFDGEGRVTLLDSANSFDFDTEGKGTWLRLEAGIGGAASAMPMLALWGDIGDRKAIGLRAGFRFGGSAEEAALPPPPPPAPVMAPPPPPPPATQTCPDGSVILASDNCPPPPPPPPPAAEPERG